jgi:hypothetical protein
MSLSAINIFVVLVAAVIAFIANFVWFGPLKMYTRWTNALQQPADHVPGSGLSTPVLFGLTFASLVVESLVIALVMFGVCDDPSVVNGLGVGLVLGVGVAAMPSLGHRLFAGQGFKVWIYEVGADVVVAGVMGIIIATLG